MARRLRYSERKLLVEQGGLGDFEHETVPEPLRNAVWHLLNERSERGVGGAWIREVRGLCVRHFGWPNETFFEFNVRKAESVEGFLDLLEIAVEVGQKPYMWSPPGPRSSFGPKPQRVKGFANAEEELNALFERHRFGYRILEGEAQRIGSPALVEGVVGPALFAAKRPGWEEVERAYREAVGHQRGGPDERDDALTAANAAVEAALKAVGLKGDRLSALAKSLRGSVFIPGELRGVPEALDVLLKRQEAIRSNHGDAHGKSPESPTVPQAMADLAVHWAGAFIVYLAAVAPENADENA